MALKEPKFRPAVSDTAVQLPQSLEDVRKCILESQARPKRKRDMASALMTLGRCAGRRLADIPATVVGVREAFDAARPALHNVGPARWRNIRSLTGKALSLCGVPVKAGRDDGPLSQSWERLLEKLPPRPGRVSLSPFARFCTRRGIEPGRVSQAVFDAYAADDEETSLRERRRDAACTLARTWNAARAQWADWPDVTLDPGDRRIRVALTWDSFPASLKQDVDAMVQAATDPWGVSSRRPIKAISAHNRAEQLRLLASAEVDAGIPAADLTSIAAVIEPARVRLGLSVIARRLKGGRTGAHINDVARHVLTLAKHWARLSLDDINELKTLCRATMRVTLGMTPKNRATLRHFQGDDGEALQRRVYELAVKHYERADFAQTLKRSDLVALQTALAIELLLVTAVRSKNLAGIDINRHLVRHGRGRMARVHLVIPGEEVKNGVAVEVELPDITVVLLDQYIAHVRPGLLRAPSRWLFPGEGAGHKAAYLLSQQIADMMERTVGVRITTHQFRHFAGATYLRENPGGHEVVRRYLGHKNIETTLNFYAGMETDVAFSHLHKLVAKKRTKKS